MICEAFRRFGPESPFDDPFGHGQRCVKPLRGHTTSLANALLFGKDRDHPREVVEAALVHVVRNPVEAAYARSDLFERRQRLMDDWAAYVNVEDGAGKSQRG